MRRELYESIPALYDDAQKYRDIIETVQWSEPDLQKLIANRIRHHVPELKAQSDVEAWCQVFADTIEYRNTKSFNYMVDRTLYRPREIIQFCADALEESRRQRLLPINYAVISRAELEYSESRTKDIAAEYRFQYPGLLSVFEVFRGKNYTLQREDLDLICLSIAVGESPVSPESSWVHDLDHEQLVDVLWRVGFLRACGRRIEGLAAKRQLLLGSSSG